MSEFDEEKDYESLHTNRLKSVTHTHRTPKTNHALDCTSRNKSEKKRSNIDSNNDAIDLYSSPMNLKSKCKSMKAISQRSYMNDTYSYKQK